MLNQLYEKINNFENKNTQGILETALLTLQPYMVTV